MLNYQIVQMHILTAHQVLFSTCMAVLDFLVHEGGTVDRDVFRNSIVYTLKLPEEMWTGAEKCLLNTGNAEVIGDKIRITKAGRDLLKQEANHRGQQTTFRQN